VLIFIGSKIFVSDFLLDEGKFPPVASLAVTFGLIAAGIACPWGRRGRGRRTGEGRTTTEPGMYAMAKFSSDVMLAVTGQHSLPRSSLTRRRSKLL
jgi:hypothetical protein